MAKFKVGDRVYHIRQGDPFAQTGFGRVLEIGGTRATLLWEHNGKHGGVETRNLITEDEAAINGHIVAQAFSGVPRPRDQRVQPVLPPRRHAQAAIRLP
jgi:hypothetical protein